MTITPATGPEEDGDYFKNSRHPNQLFRRDHRASLSGDEIIMVARVDGDVPRPYGRVIVAGDVIDAVASTLPGAARKRVRSIDEGLDWITS